MLEGIIGMEGECVVLLLSEKNRYGVWSARNKARLVPQGKFFWFGKYRPLLPIARDVVINNCDQHLSL